MNFSESLRWYRRAEGLIPSGTQTFSKGPSQYPFGVAPIYIERGSGSHVWDVDGNEFIDYPMALGSVILGHAYPVVNEAISQQLAKGYSYTLNSPLEVTVSEKLRQFIPCAEMVRFGKNGSDATAGAIRLARAFTGREMIASCGYHGWQDWYIATTTRDKGVPAFNKELIRTFGYNNIASLEAIFQENKGKVAAVIIEPVILDEPKDDFLKKVRALAHENGAVLIFDEIVSGFRMHNGGAQAYFGVTPDVACFGKALGNGMPIAAVAGKKEIMEVFDEVFFSFTFGGEALSLAAAAAVLNEFESKPVIAQISRTGQRLKEGFNHIASRLGLEAIAKCAGYGQRTAISWQPAPGVDVLELRTLFQQEAIARGILAIGVHNISFSHSDKDIDKTLVAYEETLGIIKAGLDGNDLRQRIKGELVKPIFRPLKFEAPVVAPSKS